MKEYLLQLLKNDEKMIRRVLPVSLIAHPGEVGEILSHAYTTSEPVF